MASNPPDPNSSAPPAVSPAEARSAVNRQQSDANPPPAVLPCQGSCWIEIELLDDQDTGVPREPYWVKLPTGVVREGKLNDHGWARLDGIPCGQCIVRFPRIDRQFVQPAGTHPPGKTAWLEIVLLDAEKRPVAQEPYSVKLSDGSMQTGKLDTNGRARLNGIPPGTCQVRFPGIDRGDFI